MAEKTIQPGAVAAMSHAAGDVSDAELLRRVAASDHGSARSQALELLFQRHADPLLRFLTRTLRHEHTAEDILHDVFVRVAEAASTFRGESTVRTWLFTLALNKVRSKQRRNAIEIRATDAMTAERPDHFADARHDPFEQAQQRELRQRVDVAIGELGDDERETFLLYWFGGMSYAEISAASSITVSAAKVRVHRALLRLNKLLGEATA